jgi:hypothetical protein
MNENLMEQDHVALAEIFRRLDADLCDGDAVRSFQLLDFAWARLAMHIRAEHLRLFPAIINALAEETGTGRLATPTPVEARETLARLRDDHDFFMRELAGAVQVLRDVSRDARGDASSTEQLSEVRAKIVEVTNRLEEHNRLEEERVYLWPAVLLGATAREELAILMGREIENYPARFRDSSSTEDISSEATGRIG